MFYLSESGGPTAVLPQRAAPDEHDGQVRSRPRAALAVGIESRRASSGAQPCAVPLGAPDESLPGLALCRSAPPMGLSRARGGGGRGGSFLKVVALYTRLPRRA